MPKVFVETVRFCERPAYVSSCTFCQNKPIECQVNLSNSLQYFESHVACISDFVLNGTDVCFVFLILEHIKKCIVYIIVLNVYFSKRSNNIDISAM